MTVHFYDVNAATVKREFNLMVDMHVTWVRMDVDWSAIEKDRGQFDWSYSDQIVNEASARRMNVIAVVAATPAWARPTGTATHAAPQDSSDYANFARIAAARYAPEGVRTWEIWNESNTDVFWQPRPDANQYGALFRDAAAAIRSVDPNATLLTAGLAVGADASDRVSQMTYLDQLYSNGTAQLADGIAIHPYSFPSLPMDADQQGVGGFKDLPALHDLMDKHGDGQKKIWITEFGAPTGTGPNSVSEKEQAITFMQAGEQVKLWEWAGPLIFYELADEGTDPIDKEQNFGVLRSDLTPKPAAVALMS